MKQVILGVYCNVHLDLPVMVSDDLDITKLTQSELRTLINDGKIKSNSETISDLIEGYPINDECNELFTGEFNVGSFGLSKINYVMDNENTNWLKKKELV